MKRAIRAIFSVAGKAISLKLDPEEFSQKGILDYLAVGQLYESSTVKALQGALRPDQTFIDVGAHVGYFSAIGAALVGETGHVHAFEPNFKNFKALLGNVSSLCLTAHQVAVRNTRGTSCLYRNADNNGGHACWDVGRHPANPQSRATPQIDDVITVTLDEFEFDNVGAIKIDVEGSEFEVLVGAHDTLKANPEAVVILEINRFGLAQLGHYESDIREFMKAMGYQCFLLPQDNAGNIDPVPLADDDYLATDFVFNLMFRK